MRPSAFAALALLAPLAAAGADLNSATINGQTVTLTASGSSNFGYSDCKGDTQSTFTAAWPTPVPSGATLAVWLSNDTSCSPVPNGTSVSDSSPNVPVVVHAWQVAGVTSSANCPLDSSNSRVICAVAKLGSTSSNTMSITLSYSSTPPDPPTIKSADGGDKLVHLKWSTSGTIDHVTVFYRPLTSGFDAGADAAIDLCNPPAIDLDAGYDASIPDGGFDESQFKGLDFKSTTGDNVSGLENGVTYLFFAKAVDSYGNWSDPSDPVVATPRLVHDFYSRYRCQGGDDLGGFGCTSSGAAALVPALGALGLALLRRRGGRRS